MVDRLFVKAEVVPYLVPQGLTHYLGDIALELACMIVGQFLRFIEYREAVESDGVRKGGAHAVLASSFRIRYAVIVAEQGLPFLKSLERA